MPEKPEKFKIEFEIPEYKKRELKKLGRHFPDMATNLLLAVEVVKLRWSMQNRSYTQKEVYQVVFDGFSSWMDILKWSFPADERKAKKR